MSYSACRVVLCCLVSMHAPQAGGPCASGDAPPMPPWDGRLRVPDGASVHRVHAPDDDYQDGAFEAALVLFAPDDTERRCAAVRRRPDARVLEYLRTGRAAALVTTDPDDAAAADIVCDVAVLCAGARSAVHVTADARGLRSLLAGCVPVAVLLSRRPGPLGVYNATLFRLPDGRLVCDNGYYNGEHAALCGVPSIAAAGTHDPPSPVDERWCEFMAQFWAAVRRGIMDQIARHREALALDTLRPRFAAASDVGPVTGATALARGVPPAARPSVLHLVRRHLMRLAERRRAAAAIARAWCRYDGAPHGPRARYLRDLERGWTPGAGFAFDTDCPGGAPARDVRALAGLLSDDAAYCAYGAERMAALRLWLCGAAAAVDNDGSNRVRMRRASLHGLRG